MVPLHGDGDGVLLVLAVVSVVAIGHLVSLLGVQLGHSYVQLVHAPTTTTESFLAAPLPPAKMPHCHTDPKFEIPIVQLRPFGYDAIIVTEFLKMFEHVD